MTASVCGKAFRGYFYPDGDRVFEAVCVKKAGHRGKHKGRDGLKSQLRADEEPNERFIDAVYRAPKSPHIDTPRGGVEIKDPPLISASEARERITGRQSDPTDAGPPSYLVDADVDAGPPSYLHELEDDRKKAVVEAKERYDAWRARQSGTVGAMADSFGLDPAIWRPELFIDPVKVDWIAGQEDGPNPLICPGCGECDVPDYPTPDVWEDPARWHAESVVSGGAILEYWVQDTRPTPEQAECLLQLGSPRFSPTSAAWENTAALEARIEERLNDKAFPAPVCAHWAGIRRDGTHVPCSLPANHTGRCTVTQGETTYNWDHTQDPQPLCGNTHGKDLGCISYPGHEGLHSDGWKTWR
jgi:hypothetical protein